MLRKTFSVKKLKELKLIKLSASLEVLIRAAALTMAGQYNTAALPMYGDALRLPNRKAIIEIIRSFQKLMFPVYYGEKHLLKPKNSYGSSTKLLKKVIPERSPG